MATKLSARESRILARAREQLRAAFDAAEKGLTQWSGNDDTTVLRRLLRLLQQQLGGKLPPEIRDDWKLVVEGLTALHNGETMPPGFREALVAVVKWVREQLAAPRSPEPPSSEE
jgi:Ni/Co efflux regulator RcnB